MRLGFSHLGWLLALSVGWIVAGAVWTVAADAPAKPAADSKPAADDDKSPLSPEAQTALADFDKVFDEFKAILGDLRSLQGKYQVATPAQRPDIEKQFNGLVDKGKQLAPRLLSTAEAAFAAAPKDSPQVADFLVTQVDQLVVREQYVEAHRLSKLLLDSGYENPSLRNLAGLAAYGDNDFTMARECLLKAAKANTINEQGSRYLKEVDKNISDWAKEQKIREAEAKADDLPRVKLTTSAGDIVLELFENEAPNTVANFISLVDKHFYDGIVFHRVLPNFMAQTGDPQGNGSGGPGYTIPCECYQANHRLHFAGSLSMAKKQQRDTGGSQFFLTFIPTTNLNGMHTVFGRVIEGQDVLAKLQRIDPEHPSGVKPDKILKAVVLRKRDHKYEPVTRPE